VEQYLHCHHPSSSLRVWKQKILQRYFVRGRGLEQGGELDNLRDSCSLVRTHLQKPLINPFWKLPRDLHTNFFHVRRLYSIFDRKSTVMYWVMEFRYGNRPCAERSGITWLSGGVWKLAKIRKKIEYGRCPFCLGKQSVKHTSLSGPQTWKYKNFRSK
jgi:hypothetical protein